MAAKMKTQNPSIYEVIFDLVQESLHPGSREELIHSILLVAGLISEHSDYEDGFLALAAELQEVLGKQDGLCERIQEKIEQEKDQPSKWMTLAALAYLKGVLIKYEALVSHLPPEQKAKLSELTDPFLLHWDRFRVEDVQKSFAISPAHFKSTLVFSFFVSFASIKPRLGTLPFFVEKLDENPDFVTGLLILLCIKISDLPVLEGENYGAMWHNLKAYMVTLSEVCYFGKKVI